MKKISLIVALFPLSSLAADLCPPMKKIEAKVNYCDDNTEFVKPAQTCLAHYKALVKAKGKDVEKDLAGVLRSASGQGQSEDLATSQKTLASAENTLDELIAMGGEIVDEVDDYQNDFVLPIYEGYEEDFALDPHSKEGQAVFREKECYGEPMDDLDAVKAEVGKMVKDLEKTKLEAASLRTKAKGSEGNLRSASKSATGLGKPAAQVVPKGHHPNEQSTVTGIEEDKKKQAK